MGAGVPILGTVTKKCKVRKEAPFAFRITLVLRVFIQTANREDTAAVVNEINDVVPLAIFRGADNPNRFIQRDKHQVFCITSLISLTTAAVSSRLAVWIKTRRG